MLRNFKSLRSSPPCALQSPSTARSSRSADSTVNTTSTRINLQDIKSPSTMVNHTLAWRFLLGLTDG
jgi:hypothetical protein